MITTTSSAAQLITNAQHKAVTSSHTIATLAVSENEIGSKEYNSNNLIKPVLGLKEAEIETSAAVKLLDVAQKTHGSLFSAIA